MRVAIYTLGCKVNQYETQAMEQELQRRGHTLVDFESPADAYIINTCSVQSMKGGSGDAAYVASKHAVHGLTRAWANEWGRYNIQVNGIAPGYMVTDNTAKLRQNREAVAAITAQIPLGRWGKPEDLMGPVVFLASNASNFVNGHLLVADGGYLNA